MRLYTIYERAGASPVLIAEAFSWPAALFQSLWALWRGGWWTALILFVAGLVFALVRFFGIAPEGAFGLSVIQVIAAGVLGPDLLRWDFSRRGYQRAGVIVAANHDGALWRYLAINRPSLTSDQTSDQTSDRS